MTKSGRKWMITMFMGEYHHSIDSKGRIIIPSKFKSDFGKKVVITNYLDGCLSIYTKDTWTKLEKKISALPMSKKGSRDFKRFFLGSAQIVDIDNQGRVLVSSPLRQFANLKDDVNMVGVGDHVEIWDSASWDKEYTKKGFRNSDSFAEGLEDLGI